MSKDKFKIIVAQWGNERIIVHCYPVKRLTKEEYHQWCVICTGVGMKWKTRERKHLYKLFRNEFQAFMFAADLTEITGNVAYEVWGRIEIKVSTVSGGLI